MYTFSSGQADFGTERHTRFAASCFRWLLEQCIFDLIFGRTLVFAQLDYAKLFEIAEKEGITMRWAGDKELREGRKLSSIIPGSPKASAVAYKLRRQPEAKEEFLLIGSFSRMLLELMSPSQFLELVERGFPPHARSEAATPSPA